MAVDNATLYRESQSSIQMRDDFIAIASHELRTPLTPLKMQVQLLRRRLKSPEGLGENEDLRKLIDRSEREVDRLTRLVSNLLDVTRMNAGNLELQLHDVDLNKLLNDIIGMTSSEASECGCKIIFTKSAELIGKWDTQRLEQALVNVLQNAYKFGKNKPVQIQISRDAEWAFVKIRDEGVGISKDDVARIFNRFVRTGAARNYGWPGPRIVHRQTDYRKSRGPEITVEK